MVLDQLVNKFANLEETYVGSGALDKGITRYDFLKKLIAYKEGKDCITPFRSLTANEIAQYTDDQVELFVSLLDFVGQIQQYLDTHVAIDSFEELTETPKKESQAVNLANYSVARERLSLPLHVLLASGFSGTQLGSSNRDILLNISICTQAYLCARSDETEALLQCVVEQYRNGILFRAMMTMAGKYGSDSVLFLEVPKDTLEKDNVIGIFEQQFTVEKVFKSKGIAMAEATSELKVSDRIVLVGV